jgi:hypothetical protein
MLTGQIIGTIFFDDHNWEDVPENHRLTVDNPKFNWDVDYTLGCAKRKTIMFIIHQFHLQDLDRKGSLWWKSYEYDYKYERLEGVPPYVKRPTSKKKTARPSPDPTGVSDAVPKHAVPPDKATDEQGINEHATSEQASSEQVSIEQVSIEQAMNGQASDASDDQASDNHPSELPSDQLSHGSDSD